MLRGAISGFGEVAAQAHLAGWRTLPDVNIVAIHDPVAREFLPGFLERFRRAYPHMNFEITVANSDALAGILLRGGVDIIIGYAVQVRSGLQQIVAFDLKTCITIRKDHPLAKRVSVRVADLVDQNFIMPDADSLLRQVLNAMFAKVAVKPVSTITSNSFEFITTMVAGGFGIGCQVRLARISNSNFSFGRMAV